MPSLRYSSASGTSRSPDEDTNLTFAPSAISAGALSVEDTATQRLLAVATQQVSPSFFRQ